MISGAVGVIGTGPKRGDFLTIRGDFRHIHPIQRCARHRANRRYKLFHEDPFSLPGFRSIEALKIIM